MIQLSRKIILSSAALLVLTLSDVAAAPKAQEWYVKMVAIVENAVEADLEVFYDDRSGVFGRIEGSQEDFDRHDLPAFVNLSGAKIAIVFDVQGSEEHTQFVSDYREKGKKRETWTFRVYSNRPDGTVTLAWEGAYLILTKNDQYITELDPDNKVLKKLSLVDLETGEVIPALSNGRMNSVTFDMNGAKYRNFRWVQNKVKKRDRILDPAELVETAAFTPNVQSTSSKGSKTRQSSAILPELPGWEETVELNPVNPATHSPSPHK